MKKKYSQFGFSLLELLVTVAIMAILALFALGNYRHYVTKSRLQEAISALSQNALYLEKMYSKNNGYKKPDKSHITTSDLPVRETGSGKASYTITINSTCSASDGESSDNAFCLKAVPNSQGQANAKGGGKECGTITVDQAGKYSSSGSDPNFKCF